MIKNILLIDDSQDDLEFYTELLVASDQRRKVHTADCLENALELCSSYDMDCIFIDYNMPEMNGLQIFEKLASLEPERVLAAVILTGEPHQKIQAEAARQGALDYVVKNTANTSEQLDAVIDKTVSWATSLNQ